jgi:hypothetical protein
MVETYDPHKSTNDVRQASGRKMNLRVLTISLGIVIVLFALLFWYFGMQPTTATTGVVS